MKNRNRILAVSLVVVILLGIYIVKGMQYRNTFLPRTSVAGLSIGGKTTTQANTALKEHFHNQSFTFMDGTKKVGSFKGKDAGVTPNFKESLTTLQASQNPWLWPLHLLTGGNVSAEQSLDLNNQTFNQFFNTTNEQLNKGRKASQDATVAKRNNGFVVTKAVYGNQLASAKLKASIKSSLTSGNTTVQLKNDYTKPAVTGSAAQLKTAKTKLEKIHAEKITYKINGKTLQVPAATIYDWETYNNGKVAVDTAKVKQYVVGLNNRYATYIKSIEFNSTKQGKVKVPAGNYGWSIKTSSESAALASEVLKEKDFTREPVTVGIGYGKDGIGNTYVEVDKSAQHMWVYKNGKSVLDTDVVTGKPGQDTPSGVYFVWNKQRNTKLTGKNDNGSAYSSAVSYWMPVDYTGVGIHDASWQPTFGGDWYKTHGSHGCINTPPTTMAKVYADVALDTPVIIF
ncbi:L,D-transpeptidase family protein [Loigolactobacillus iwatensis]|uniref:L,D-transpeptidase family protein n=1 Tax=Loigolactobacillus iwatensis TaxID=1267156 RepID=UPI000F7DF77C|nr:L,D-transpeptidase family protein [Loigolactobacillus iwatensis]